MSFVPLVVFLLARKELLLRAVRCKRNCNGSSDHPISVSTMRQPTRCCVCTRVHTVPSLPLTLHLIRPVVHASHLVLWLLRAQGVGVKAAGPRLLQSAGPQLRDKATSGQGLPPHNTLLRRYRAAKVVVLLVHGVFMVEQQEYGGASDNLVIAVAPAFVIKQSSAIKIQLLTSINCANAKCASLTSCSV